MCVHHAKKATKLIPTSNSVKNADQTVPNVTRASVLNVNPKSISVAPPTSTRVDYVLKIVVLANSVMK